MADEKTQELLSRVADYYSDKLKRHGETPQGADWNGEDSQTLRFKQLTKVLTPSESFSLNDVGCGYGALYDFLKKVYKNFSYIGYDVSEGMIAAAQLRHGQGEGTRYVLGSEPRETADYGVASGIFNVRLDCDDLSWREYIEHMLDALDRTSLRGFSFNCLTSFSQPEKMRDYLYYADPCYFFSLCKRRYSRDVALFHDYGLYEFTIIVRKET